MKFLWEGYFYIAGLGIFFGGLADLIWFNGPDTIPLTYIIIFSLTSIFMGRIQGLKEQLKSLVDSVADAQRGDEGA